MLRLPARLGEAAMPQLNQLELSVCATKVAVCDLVGNHAGRWVAFLIEIAPLISAIAVGLGAVVALCTLAFVHRRAYLKSIDDDFARLDEFFWTDDRIAAGRDLVTYEASFIRVKNNLDKMNRYDFLVGDGSDKYDDAERADIESVNCFCACIARVHLLSEGRLSKRQRRMFNAMFGYWIMEIGRRPELAAYYCRYWVAPIGEVKEVSLLRLFVPRSFFFEIHSGRKSACRHRHL